MLLKDEEPINCTDEQYRSSAA